ncbi:hypothetical protein TSTA_009380 [Talaromyces stipitatus ATCC 10500]|uniref:Transcription factor domain-containing protein n=1 Tax=Talaromyces stipitatus (strain ATCC 10500 / CBS 375.48 / QM 6759 / NRRL 1006) TaxID=441959 RepID=B8MFU9_TALSN|nr:uncharacterized protein TSTA_009380 [Talaromyces stipitatus ATCC 10500]EED15816.1 hypothetical protein TSTA_009380 [Talaromyces stipitatus ATCC 10500]
MPSHNKHNNHIEFLSITFNQNNYSNHLKILFCRPSHNRQKKKRKPAILAVIVIYHVMKAVHYVAPAKTREEFVITALSMNALVVPRHRLKRIIEALEENKARTNHRYDELEQRMRDIQSLVAYFFENFPKQIILTQKIEWESSRTQQILAEDMELNPAVDAATTENESDGDLSIPLDHCTAAHKLLSWPSIQRLLGQKDFDIDYVMRLEEDRGVIRIYGHGEGKDDGGPHWGDGLPIPSLSYQGVENKVDGIDRFGALDTHRDTLRRLHRSFMENIYPLHPVLDKAVLEQKIENFSNQYSKANRPIERSIDNAVILLVLALGAICEWKVRIPALTKVEDTAKNMHVIPGLAYYAHATDFLGNMQGGSGISNVQAALLAGLYTGQLAHPFQSHGWISQAARACLILVHPRKYTTLQDERMKDLCNAAYWACLQLESDILAELDLPPSGISRSEDRIDLPKGLHYPEDSCIMLFYSAQIHLRKVLNRVHTYLYKTSNGKKLSTSNDVLEILGKGLDSWRQNLPREMQWDDNDEPSSDINTARLRAKYYGARYIIYRPLLRYALNRAIDSGQTLVGLSSPKSEPISPTLHPVESTDGTIFWDTLPRTVQTACKICINAAVRSTRAFHNIQGRPIITNVFGTAHAQFGNMLVLSVTYASHLRHLVERSELQSLLKRTITFLEDYKHLSPTLSVDAEILAKIYSKIFQE